jgi:aspartokinase-like uncharacterized kinase
MIVIKLGGSLVSSNQIQACLDKIERVPFDKQVVIVPGGGVFAEQVRQVQQQWRFDDRTAHLMAVLAMQQMALLFRALKPCFAICESIAEIREQVRQNGIVIWSPDAIELDTAGIQSTWDISSDSLSAWLADALGVAELMLVKSVKSDRAFDVLNLVQRQVVDASFHTFTQHKSFKLNIVYVEEFIS